MLQAILLAGGLVGGLGGAIGLVLALAAGRLREDAEAAVDAVDRLLPQTQCAQCGFPGCRPYARAVVQGSAPPDLCPPGGPATAAAIAERLGLALDPGGGEEPAPAVAWIDESACVGCAICLDACPVDAIVGAPRYLHTVVADECTGCALCVEPCPVDCIAMHPLGAPGEAPPVRPGR